MPAFEVALPRRPVKNPQPLLVSCGDCGACVLAGLLGITVEQAYERHENGYWYRGPLETEPAKKREQRDAFSYHTMSETLRMLHHNGELDRVITDPPLWVINNHIEMNGAWGATNLLQQGAFKRYCTAMFDAGYYGIAQVNMHGKGFNTGTDHWVMLCGSRQVHDGNLIREEILIGDSALSKPLERWIGWNDFLQNHGGFMAFFARPR